MFLPALCLADFSYQQTSKMTGGLLAGAAAMTPTETTVAVKGPRLVHATAKGSTIIDVQAQTITHTNNDNKTYYVTTFDEMRNLSGGKVGITDVKVDMKDGGNSKTLLGHETRDKVMTITSTVTDERSGAKIDTVIHNDMYLAPGIAGTEELRDFYKKAVGLEWAQGGMPGMNRPEMVKALSEAYRSVGAIDGLPLLTVMSINGGMPGMPQMSGADGAKMAGLAAILAKRRQQQSGTPAQPDGAPGALMQMTMEVTSYSDKPVDPALFKIPADYKKTDPPSIHGGPR